MPDIDFSRVFFVFLNGPPGCGKDSGAEAVRRSLQHPGVREVRCVKFAAALKRSVAVDAGYPADTPLEDFEAEKEVPKAVWGGVSFRQRCILKSENYMKPMFGEEIFGELFLSSAENEIKSLEPLRPEIIVFLVTDSGFAKEAMPTLRKVPHENILHARIHAEKRGKSFANDSRSYITLPDTVRVIDIENNEEGEEAFSRYVTTLGMEIIRTIYPGNPGQ